MGLCVQRGLGVLGHSVLGSLCAVVGTWEPADHQAVQWTPSGCGMCGAERLLRDTIMRKYRSLARVNVSQAGGLRVPAFMFVNLLPGNGMCNNGIS